MKKLLLAAAAVLGVSALSGCLPDAQVANQNLTTEADNFKLLRKTVFYNVWTDQEVAVFTGFCSIEDKGNRFWVTCKDADGFKRHQLGSSANMTYFMIQLDSADVSTYHTKIVWKPQSFIPDIDVRVDTDELLSTDHIDNES
ncbi:site-specific recombination directionality factor RDF [Roseobacter phage RD-1410W1-01]|uniref:Lipoprotein n=1 Tax=Roseobacter phage RD-1410W1-01 TaxID=1815984 RepID=A0A191VYJ1_9CAUD|nr:site-specific recombination directionality factor RDF [Roseobacter phage RD-1410W1-01]ANJ20778.1 hypothetical protein RDp01_gp44 [Roseobacter phage RD-1410W1-01]